MHAPRIGQTLLFSIILITLSSAADASPQSQTPAQGAAAPTNASPEKPAAALRGFDPVAFVEGKELPGIASLAIDHKGFRYLFANAENRQAFERDPSKYEIQLDGHCGAMPGVAGNPEIFAAVKGRIYIFGTPGCRSEFTVDPERHLPMHASRKNVAVFIHEGVELLDFAGPTEVFAAADHGRAYRVYTVAPESGPLTSQGVVSIIPEFTIDNCPKPDIIVLPGGNTGIALVNPRVIEWIKQASADESTILMSVCTGAFLLADAGLLEGKRATTHWGSIDDLRREAPNTTVVNDARIVDNGRIITTAGVSAGIDGALHLVDRLLGREVAQRTARYMEYNWQPPVANE